MNFTDLSAVVYELSSLISGARVKHVFEDDRKSIILVLHNGAKDFFLLVSADRSLPRIHLLTKKPASKGSLGQAALQLKSRTLGGRIDQIGMLNGDRIVQILFSKQGEETGLFFEAMGHKANLVVTDSSDSIRSVYYPAPPGQQKTRALLPGLKYVLPEKKFSDGLPRDQPAEQSSDGIGRANREAELLYDRIIRQREFESSRSQLCSLTKKMLCRTERKLSALGNDMRAALEAENHKRAGELILANLDQLQAGSNEAILSGSDGKAVPIRLDPAQSPSRNAEQYFKKYKKAKAGAKIIGRMLNQTQNEIYLLQKLLRELAKADSESSVACLRALLEEKGYLSSGTGGEMNIPAALPFRKITIGSWEILVGKSAKGNDYITTRLSRPDDLWLHAEGLPGSHVLIRNPRRTEIPADILEKAASLAAFYSKGRSMGKVPVAFTFARFVRKSRGTKPGMVTLTSRRTITAIPSDHPAVLAM